GPCDRKPIEAPERPDGALQKRDLIADRRLELPAPAADKKCTYIGFTHIGVGGRGLLREFDCLPDDLGLAEMGPPCQLLDPVAVAVARTEIQVFVIGLLPEDPIDMRDVLEPDTPFGIV